MIVYHARSFGMAFVRESGNKRAGDHELEPRLDLARRSDQGFAWGYGGSGPHQFGLAILADHFGRTMKESQEPDARALRLYQRFTFRAIAARDRVAPFEMTSDEVARIVADLEQEDRREARHTEFERVPLTITDPKTGVSISGIGERRRKKP